jgi:hypothetical protein
MKCIYYVSLMLKKPLLWDFVPVMIKYYSEYSIIASPRDQKFCCNYRIVAIIDNCNFLKNSYKLQLKKKKFKTRVLRYCLTITEIL